MGSYLTLKPIILLFSLSLFTTLSYSLPLSTNGRWIIDTETGKRVKLTCANWPSHTQSMLVEGLNHRPLKELAEKAINLRFNCIRLTYATHMFTRYANRTIEENFEMLGLDEAKEGLEKNNGFVLNKTVVEAYEAVVDELGAHGLMVVADNHISQPTWCCGFDDGNGFFGDRDFDPQEWLLGLGLVAQRFNNKSTVVAMSLRNEIRGAHENAKDWNNYMTKALQLVHNTNPNVLVIVSGLNFDNDLRCQKQNPLAVTNNLDNKLAFEVHLYSFSGDSQNKYINQPLNKICGDVINGFIDHAGFVMRGEKPFPLFVSEFGYDQREGNEADNRYMSCFSAHLVGEDLDWALWGWQGSYYLREGKKEADEVFGVLDSSWTQLRNPNFSQRFQLLQTMIQDPNSKLPTSYIMYHPQSGQCIRVNNKNELNLNNCSNSSQWSHDGDGTPIRLNGKGLCLKTVRDGLPPILSSDCLSQQSIWKSVSNSKLHLAVSIDQGKSLCLEREAPNSLKIVTRGCICIGGEANCLADTQSQWFKLMSTNTM